MITISPFVVLSLFVCASILLFHPAVLSADPTPSDDPIVVSLTRTPVHLSQLPTNVTVITREEIEQSGAHTLDDLLDRVAGVQVGRSGGLGTLSTVRVRAVPTSNQVQVLVDNQPMGGVSIQDLDVSLFSVSNIDRIEIVRGGASVLYGANTIGGVINVITKKGTPGGSEISFDYEGGSFDTRVVSAIKNISVDRLSGRIGVGGFETRGYQENAQVDDVHATGHLAYNLGRGAAVTLDFSHLDRDLGNPSGTPVSYAEWDGRKERRANTPTSVINNRLSTARLGAVVPLEHFQWETQIYHSDLRYQIRFAPEDDPFATHNNYISGVDTRLHLDDGSLFGVDYERNQRRSLGQDAHHIVNVGAYFQDHLRAGGMHLYPGLRYDHHSTFGSQYNPRVSAVLPIIDNLKLSANAARSFRAPTLSNLYDDFIDPMFPEYDFFGNDQLQPEKAWTYDAGSELRLGNAFRLSVTGFRIEIKDRIASVDNNDDGIEETLANGSKAKTEGLESALRLLTGPMTHDLNHTFQEASGTSADSAQWVPLRMTPKHMFNYRLTWNLPLQLTLMNDLRYVMHQYQRDDHLGVRLPPHAVWNARLDYRIGTLRLHASVHNITDRLYGESVSFSQLVPQPTRTYRLGASVAFAK